MNWPLRSRKYYQHFTVQVALFTLWNI